LANAFPAKHCICPTRLANHIVVQGGHLPFRRTVVSGVTGGDIDSLGPPKVALRLAEMQGRSEL